MCNKKDLVGKTTHDLLFLCICVHMIILSVKGNIVCTGKSTTSVNKFDIIVDLPI